MVDLIWLFNCWGSWERWMFKVIWFRIFIMRVNLRRLLIIVDVMCWICILCFCVVRY